MCPNRTNKNNKPPRVRGTPTQKVKKTTNKQAKTAAAKATKPQNRIKNAYLLVEFLAQGSNPNGDPDENGAPRVNAFGIGTTTGTSIKRQTRDMILDRTPAFLEAAEKLELPAEGFDIYVRPDLKPSDLAKMPIEEFTNRFWDARVFGSCLLTGSDNGSGGKDKPNTPPTRGVIQVEDAETLAPVIIADRTGTRKGGVEDGKDRGMRDRKVVTHGLYRCVIVISDRRGNTSGATDKDIALFIELLKSLYSQNSEASRGTRLENIYMFEPYTSITVSEFERNVGLKLKDGVTTPASINDYDQRDSSALKGKGTLTKVI